MSIKLFLFLLCGYLVSSCTSSKKEIPSDNTNTKIQAPDGMVWIPGGDFTMGSTEENPATSALPFRQVKLDGFWMDETEPYLFSKLSQIKPRLFPAYNYYLYLHENKKPDCGH